MRNKELEGPREVRRRRGDVHPPVRIELRGPFRARKDLRRFFDPVAGGFRRLERAVNQFLSRYVFTRIPGSEKPFDRILERSLTVAHGEVGLERLQSGLDGAGVLLITDVHAGPFVSPGTLCRTFARLKNLNPDLILLGGDLTTSRVSEIDEYAEALSLLEAPLGTWAVLGNHDHYTLDPGGVRRSLEALGIRVLHNASAIVGGAGGRIFLAGIDDLNIGNPDLGSALAGMPADVPAVLLTHNPDIVFDASEMGVDLVLAGHTHGGQIRIPGLPVLVRMSRYRLDEGRFTTDGTQLVVSRGLGVTGIPLRIACPPEAVFLRLRSRPGRRKILK
jgi:predicted MPP superfamily phosphohydrolase